jgi:perosamine synthetase
LINNSSDNEWKIPLYKIYTDEEDVGLITKIVKRGSNWAIGPEIEEFENALKNYVGCDYCLTLNSGTSALHATLLANNFGHEDEIIVPSFTFIATVNSTKFVGASPIFADIESENLGLDPQSIIKNLSKKTKAVLPIDYSGLSCKIFEIKQICEDNNLRLIEDAAESLGSKVRNKKVGSISDSSIFSFCGNKVLTTGEGGAIVTNSKTEYERIKTIRSHGRLDKSPYFGNPSDSEYVGVGYNWRMSSITATLGISQLHKLDKLIKMRQEVASYFSRHLSKFDDIDLPIPPEGYDHIYQMYSILLKDKSMRDELQQFLIKKRIFSKIYFQPVHLMKFYQKLQQNNINLPVTESISEKILTLPIYPNMTHEERNYLLSSIDEFFEVYLR